MRIETYKLNLTTAMCLLDAKGTLHFRKEVDLERGFMSSNYKPEDMSMENSRPNKKHWRGILLWLATWMELARPKWLTHLLDNICPCLVKTYPATELVDFLMIQTAQRRDYVAYSMGITDADVQKFRLVYEQAPDIKFVCIDVANGYSERFTDFVREFQIVIHILLLLLVMWLQQTKHRS